MPERIDRVLISRDRIAARVRELGLSLSADLEAELRREGVDPASHADRVVLMPILTGSMVFTADLIRDMPLKLSMRVVTVSSYPGASTQSKGAMLRGAMPPDLSGRHVVILDDILDSGQTLALIRALVLEQKPASVRIAVALRKNVRRAADVTADYVGFDIPDEFVVGYGLDYDGFYRNLPDVAVLSVS
jgi:hypoxanthine phosphoribosyltransferase